MFLIERKWFEGMANSIMTTVLKKICQDQLFTLKSSSFSRRSLFHLPVLLVLLDFIHPHQQNVVVKDPIPMVERINKDRQVRQPTSDIKKVRERVNVQRPPLREDDERVLQSTKEPFNDKSVGADALVEVISDDDRVWDESISSMALVSKHRRLPQHPLHLGACSFKMVMSETEPGCSFEIMAAVPERTFTITSFFRHCFLCFPE